MFLWILAAAFAVGLLLLALMEIEIVRLRRGRARMQQLVQLATREDDDA